MQIPTFKDIIKAHSQIIDTINETPVLISNNINNLLNSNIFFKCENFQKVGAFKFRGAVNAVYNLTPDELKNGVATHSSGNHAAALALAAKYRNTKAYIVMPENAPQVKKMLLKVMVLKLFFANLL